jgi:hypothetical protein
MSIRILEVMACGCADVPILHIVGVTLGEKAPFTGPDIYLDKLSRYQVCLPLPPTMRFANGIADDGDTCHPF